MRLVIFGLAVSSSWGNGHAALWRGLIRALLQDGHEVVFFERDVPWYADHRDLTALPPGGELVLYDAWDAALAAEHVAAADAAIVTSFCPDGAAAADVIGRYGACAVFYDLDTPVTLDLVARDEPVAWLPPDGLRGFDLVLSFTGGPSLAALHDRLGARRVMPLYGCVDPAVHHAQPPRPEFGGALSYIGTYAEDRQPALRALFLDAAQAMPAENFVLAGAQYPADFPWAGNILFVRHLPPADHASFYASSRLTLNITRAAMARTGWCPSGRLFEAAACGAAIISDAWDGLDSFFAPGREILLARTTDDVLAALRLPPADLAAIGRRARDRALADHTAAARARELIAHIASTGTQVRNAA